MTGCTSGGYDQFETSPEAIEQELRPAVCERDRLMANYSIDDPIFHTHIVHIDDFPLNRHPPTGLLSLVIQIEVMA